MKKVIPFNLAYNDDTFWEIKSELGRYAFQASDQNLRRMLLRLEVTDTQDLKMLSYKGMINKAKERGNLQMFVDSEIFPESLEHIKDLLI